MAATDTGRSKQSGFGELAAILAGIVLGGVAGVFYGRPMWIAAGGPELAVVQLDKTIDQKRVFADAADAEAQGLEREGDRQGADARRQEAERLRSHVDAVQAERQEMLRIAAQAQQVPGGQRFARLSWELTQFVGDLFLQVLRLLVIPLVMTSMISGITSLGDIRKVGRVGGWTLVYYTVTCALAVGLGILLVQVIQPGTNVDDTFAYVSEDYMDREQTSIVETLLAVFRGRPDQPGSGMFPSNIFLAASETNVLGLLVFALVFGGALTTVGEKGQAAITFFHAANEAIMKMVRLVMLFAPVGIFGLVCFQIAKNGGGQAFGEQLGRLGWYVMTVLVGLGVHGLVLALLLTVFARRNPLRYTYGVLQALLTALSTSSSSATLPLTMQCVEENNGVSNRSASFVLPLGATINMDGTALYEAVAVIFIAQSLGIPLGGGTLLVIFFTATLAAIGAAGIPQAGLVTMVIVLTAAGLPTTGVGTILAIDWFLDRLRTTVNVYGDAVGAGIIDRYVQGDVAPRDRNIE